MLRPESLDPGTIASNLTANLSLHWGTPWRSINEALAALLRSLHSALGLDMARLYPYFGGLRIIAWSTDEDIAGNPLHLLLAVMG